MLIVGFVIVGLVRVLFVSVSVVALPTRVSDAEGSVSAPDATAEAIMEVVPDVAPKNKIWPPLGENKFKPLPICQEKPALFVSNIPPAVSLLIVAGSVPPAVLNAILVFVPGVIRVGEV